MRFGGAPGAAPLGAVILAWAMTVLMACSAARPGGIGPRNDRVTVDRDYIRLDDPLFLHSPETYGHRGEGAYSFRLLAYSNARPGDSLRFGRASALVRPAAPVPPDSGAGVLPEPIACLVDTLDDAPDSAALAARLADTASILALPALPARGAALPLAIHCPGYRPPFGRIDTLELSFERRPGPGPGRMLFPFHANYHAPAVSILLGAALLYAFTQAGWSMGRSH
jgi:hypothetical protein